MLSFLKLQRFSRNLSIVRAILAATQSVEVDKKSDWIFPLAEITSRRNRLRLWSFLVCVHKYQPLQWIFTLIFTLSGFLAQPLDQLITQSRYVIVL